MAIQTNPYLSEKDIYIDYPFEGVMFRITCKEGLIFRKFYGKQECEMPIPFSNRLYNDALLFGEDISLEEYLKGSAQYKKKIGNNYTQ